VNDFGDVIYYPRERERGEREKRRGGREGKAIGKRQSENYHFPY
jgi:hypothetical protein